MAPVRRLLLRVLCAAAPLLLLALPAAATSYVMMDDGDLADQAAVIAEVQVASSQPAPAQRSAGTDYLVDLVRTIKGSPAGSSIVVREPGGLRPDGLSLQIWGAPELREGERLLLFLTEHDDGTYGILHLLLGAFREPEVEGRLLAIRNLSDASAVIRGADGKLATAPGEDRPRDLARFAAWLADRAQGISRKADYFVTLGKGALENLQGKFTLYESGGRHLRWFIFDQVGGSAVWQAYQSGQGGVPGGGFSEFQHALAAWDADPLTPVRYVYGGSTAAKTGLKSNDGVNAILFGDPNQEIDGSFDCAKGGILAIGGPWIGVAPARFNGETFFPIIGGDIVTNDGIDCFFHQAGSQPGPDFEEIVTHELGHTLGLRHSCGDGASPACFTDFNKDDAIMRAVIHGGGRGARLGVDDLAGLRRLYGEQDAAPGPCRPSDRALCLAGRRFRVELSWLNQFDGSTGIGRAIPASDVAGYFSFGDPGNIELLVKALDFGTTFKIFYGELTNLKFTLTVTDTQSGNFKTYGNTFGDCGDIDQDFFAGASIQGWSTAGARSAVLPVPAAASGSCRPGRGVLCLLDGRFALQVAWRNPFDGSSGQAGPKPLSNFVGTFYFTDPSNVELMTKVIPFPDRVVFFYGALSDFQYTISVDDTLTGRAKTYRSRPGELCGGLDNTAF